MERVFFDSIAVAISYSYYRRANIEARAYTYIYIYGSFRKLGYLIWGSSILVNLDIHYYNLGYYLWIPYFRKLPYIYIYTDRIYTDR